MTEEIKILNDNLIQRLTFCLQLKYQFLVVKDLYVLRENNNAGKGHTVSQIGNREKDESRKFFSATRVQYFNIPDMRSFSSVHLVFSFFEEENEIPVFDVDVIESVPHRSLNPFYSKEKKI